ncbi:MAG: hypothetical protein ACYCZ0_03935 [Minisyncoccota bacterium]
MGFEGRNRRPNRMQMRQETNRMHGGRSSEEIDKANAAQNTLPEKTLINGRRLNRTQMREETNRMIAARTVEQSTASEAPAAAETPADEDELEATQ